MVLKAVIFDMDDTLVDWSGFLHEHYAESRRKHLSQFYTYLASAGHALPDLDQVGESYARVLVEMWDQYDGMNDNLPHYSDMLEETLRRVNVDTSGLDWNELQTKIIGVIQPGVCAYPDARTVLESIRASGLLTGLLTNAPYPIYIRHTELESMNLMDLFDVKVTAEDIRFKKPNPRAFITVADRLGVKPEEAVYVGDLLKDDVMGSQSAGMRAVWVRRRNETEMHGIQPDATIHQLTELLDLLPGWRQLTPVSAVPG